MATGYNNSTESKVTWGLVAAVLGSSRSSVVDKIHHHIQAEAGMSKCTYYLMEVAGNSNMCPNSALLGAEGSPRQ